MYLTTSRPDIVHATCYCARYQARPADSIGTPMATKPLDDDLSGTLVNQMKYHSMVG
ncbi:hypothetical protein Tco_0605078, partial [Tanacetum coccineum]